MTLRERFIAFDNALLARGVPPLTEWWRDGIGRWLDAYENNRVLELWACVGRGAAKSTALYKLCLFFTLFVACEVPPGERHFGIILSRLKEEASKALGVMSRWLTLLGVEHRLAGDVIELETLPRGIRVVAASVAATSGWRAFFIGKDERSKWPFGGLEEMDADEIDTSAAAMTATHPYAPTVTAGSAWGAYGGFYNAIIGGTNESRVVLGPVPTWIAAPHIRREDLLRKEKDPRRFAREYECNFQSGALSAFDMEDVDASFRQIDRLTALGPPVLILDPSAGRGDTWSWCLASMAVIESDPSDVFLYDNNGVDPRTGKPVRRRLLNEFGHPLYNEDFVAASEPLLTIRRIAGLEGTFSKSITAAAVVANLAYQAKLAGAIDVCSDQYEAFLGASLFNANGMRFHRYDITSKSKPEAYLHLRRLFKERRISISPHDKMRAELIEARETIQPSSVAVFGGPKAHDYASLCVVAALHDLAGGFYGSPTQLSQGVTSATAADFQSTL